MNSVTVLVIKDEFVEYPDGYHRAIKKDATVVRMEDVRMLDDSVRSLLYVKDDQARKLWINETLASWNAKTGTTNTGGGGVTLNNTIQFTIGDAQPSTPIDGTRKYLNTALLGKAKNTCTIDLNQFGRLVWNRDFVFDDADGGGFILLPSFPAFSTDTDWTVKI